MARLQRMDIYPGENAAIDIAVQLDGDSECYGWSNDSYLQTPFWRPHAWKLLQGEYLVRIRVLSSGETLSGVFKIKNAGTRLYFEIQQASKAEEMCCEQQT